MRVQTVSQTGAGNSSAIVMNTNISPFNVGFCVDATGTVDYTVQHTFDDPSVGFTLWFDHPTIAAQSTDKDGNYAFPVSGIRLKVNSGGGSAVLKLIQAGI
jgi:hypothetical protein